MKRLTNTLFFFKLMVCHLPVSALFRRQSAGIPVPLSFPYCSVRFATWFSQKKRYKKTDKGGMNVKEVQKEEITWILEGKWISCPVPSDPG